MKGAMEKQITAIPRNVSRADNAQPRRPIYTSSFARALAESEKTTAPAGPGKNGRLMLVGEISRSRQTVSELLMHNRHLKGSTWKILSANVNQGRDYTSLRPGTRIYYNPADGSLSWSGSENNGPAGLAAVSPATVAKPVTAVLPVVSVESPATPAAGVELGTISKDRPTVSHLLKDHPQYSGDTWKILGLAANSSKSFDRIPVGARVTLDPTTREINWQAGSGTVDGGQPAEMAATAAAAPRPLMSEQRPDPAFLQSVTGVANIAALPMKQKPAAAEPGQAGDLTEAVRPYFGKQYREINCYELLVKGLERMNIPYTGKDGLFTKLTRMAKEQGLPANAYLNGEGVVKAAGSLVLSRNYPHTGNWRREADKLYSEMEPLLDRGQVLSFSTRRRGHTGIVSRHDEQWTFINSGRLDNSLTKGVPRQGVGEENLRQEIHNWFKLASKSRESLSVTLGSLTPGRVITARNGISGSEEAPRRI